MKKPVIGVLPLFDEKKDSIWMLPGYMDMLSAAGAVPLILPFGCDGDLARFLEICDGFLFTGGHDTDPSVYGEERIPACGATCAARDSLEGELLRLCIGADVPVFGICRGIQFINAALGGTLWQDLPSQRPTRIAHCMKPPYDRIAHTVSFVPDGPLHRLLGVKEAGVNSYHHQAVQKTAPGLEPMAWSEDGLCEGLYRSESSFLWAVQWHPEFSYKTDPLAFRQVEAFRAACAAYRERTGRQ